MTQTLFPADFLRDYKNLKSRVEKLETLAGATQIDVGPVSTRPAAEGSNRRKLWIVSDGNTRQITQSTGASWEAVAPPITV